MNTDDLIARLAGELRPVKRLAPPLPRAAAWLGLAALVVAAAVLALGPRHDLMERLSRPHEVAQLVFALATGVLAAIAAFELSLPDRSPRWAWLRLPAAAGWIGSLGMGCLADVAREGPQALVLGTSWGCFRFIVLMGVPLAVSLVWMLRHAGPIRPVPVAVLGGLAGAAISAPKPSSSPSTNRVEALTTTAAASTSWVKRVAARRSVVTMASLWPVP